MAFDITTTAETLQTAMRALQDADGHDVFFAVDIATPKNGRPQGPYAVIHPGSISVIETTLKNTVQRHVLRVEVHVSPTAVSNQERALLGARIASQVLEALCGDFTLGGSVRNVDITGLAVEFADREIDDVPSRVAEITVPLIVDGTQDFTA